MSEMPEQMWANLDHWTRQPPPEGGYKYYSAYTRKALYDAVVAERDELLAGLEEIRCIAFAATNPANWQTGDTSDAARLKHYENTLDSIADRNQHITILEDTFRSMTVERDALKENYRACYEAFCAMRNDINEMFGNMISSEATLKDGPEMSSECAAVVSSLRAVKDRSDALREAFATIATILENAPELNLSNYDHDQVCELNNKMCEAYAVMRDGSKNSDKGDAK